MSRGGAVRQYGLGMPDDPASRWLLYLADEDCGASVRQTAHSIDVVHPYVNSFRKARLRVGLYYSILSLRDDIRHFNVTPAKVQLIKDQYSDVKAFEQNAGQKVPKGSDVPALSCVTLTDEWFWKQRDADGPLKPVKTVVEEWLEPLNRRHCNLILKRAK